MELDVETRREDWSKHIGEYENALRKKIGLLRMAPSYEIFQEHYRALQDELQQIKIGLSEVVIGEEIDLYLSNSGIVRLEEELDKLHGYWLNARLNEQVQLNGAFA